MEITRQTAQCAACKVSLGSYDVSYTFLLYLCLQEFDKTLYFKLVNRIQFNDTATKWDHIGAYMNRHYLSAVKEYDSQHFDVGV